MFVQVHQSFKNLLWQMPETIFLFQLRKMVKNHNICLACRKYLYSHSNSCEFCFQGMCWILETLIQSGWEISTSSMTNVTTGYDAGSYFLKKNSAPALHNAQVAAVVIGKNLALKIYDWFSKYWLLFVMFVTSCKTIISPLNST